MCNVCWAIPCAMCAEPSHVQCVLGKPYYIVCWINPNALYAGQIHVQPTQVLYMLGQTQMQFKFNLLSPFLLESFAETQAAPERKQGLSAELLIYEGQGGFVK